MTNANALINKIQSGQFTDHYQRHPYAQPDSGLGRGFLTWDILDEILRTGHADCWLVRQGKILEDASVSDGLLTVEQAALWYTRGYTVLIRHAEKILPQFREIAESFVEVFSAPVDIQLFFTPPGGAALDWHFDNEEVFIIQCSGEKEFFLKANREVASLTKANPPVALEAGGLSCKLFVGDFLYIPSGYWHRAQASDGVHSFHVTIGVSPGNRGQAIGARQ